MRGEVQEKAPLGVAQVRPLTAVTALAWYDGHQNIRLYCQNTAGSVTEACGTDGNWGPGAVLTGPAPGSKLATTMWRDGGGVHIRLYYQDEQHTLRELCYEAGGWYAGRLAVTDAAPGTAVAAVSWRNSQGDVHIRVYFQDTANRLVEQCNDHGSWATGGLSRPVATVSAGVAATQWTDAAGFHLQVYWFTELILSYPVVTVASYDSSDGQWKPAYAAGVPGDGSDIAVLQWSDSAGGSHRRIIHQSYLGPVVGFDLDNGLGSENTFGAAPAPGTSIALARFADSTGDHVRLYYQGQKNSILEYAQDAGTWWAQPAVVPTC
jgi:hypothetical protein